VLRTTSQRWWTLLLEKSQWLKRVDSERHQLSTPSTTLTTLCNRWANSMSHITCLEGPQIEILSEIWKTRAHSCCSPKRKTWTSVLQLRLHLWKEWSPSRCSSSAVLLNSHMITQELIFNPIGSSIPLLSCRRLICIWSCPPRSISILQAGTLPSIKPRTLSHLWLRLSKVRKAHLECLELFLIQQEEVSNERELMITRGGSRAPNQAHQKVRKGIWMIRLKINLQFITSTESE